MNDQPTLFDLAAGVAGMTATLGAGRVQPWRVRAMAALRDLAASGDVRGHGRRVSAWRGRA